MLQKLSTKEFTYASFEGPQKGQVLSFKITSPHKRLPMLLHGNDVIGVPQASPCWVQVGSLLECNFRTAESTEFVTGTHIYPHPCS